MSESQEYPLDAASNPYPPRLTKAAARAKRRADRDVKKDPIASSKVNYKALEAKTPRQHTYIKALKAGQSAIAVGGAGTGKTYVAARIFAKKLLESRIDKIIIARVTVGKAKHSLGFLPGKLDAKLAPWLVPVIEGIRAEISAAAFEQLKEAGKIEFASFEHMRGRTFKDCCVLLDEAQNADFGDLKLLLTRWGEGAQYVVTGDMDQIDVHDSGLDTVIGLVKKHAIPINIIAFTDDDVVRSPMAKAWVKAFSAHSAAQRGDHTPMRHYESYLPEIAPVETDDVNLDTLPDFLNNGLVTKRVAQ